jgi:hypothetical protein
VCVWRGSAFCISGVDEILDSVDLLARSIGDVGVCAGRYVESYKLRAVWLMVVAVWIQVFYMVCLIDVRVVEGR